MAVSNRGESSRLTSEDLSAKQFFIVQMDTNGLIELAEGALDFIVGVLQNKPESGQAATYRHQGTSKVQIGGTVAIGDWLTTAADGEAIATTTDGNIVIGRALQAGVDGDIIEVQLGIQHIFIA